MEVLLAENKVSERQKGFSLVELMVTIVIGAVLLAIALGAYNELQERTRVESAKEHIVSILQQARLRALSSGESQVVAFDWPADSITYSGETTIFDLVDLKGFRTTGLQSNDTNTDNTFTFSSRGSVSFGGTPVVGGGAQPRNLQISSASSSSAFVISVNIVTGRIAVANGLSC
jgi:prepilin-type N-terminal cleavage/methylation domain-containing protein